MKWSISQWDRNGLEVGSTIEFESSIPFWLMRILVKFVTIKPNYFAHIVTLTQWTKRYGKEIFLYERKRGIDARKIR